MKGRNDQARISGHEENEKGLSPEETAELLEESPDCISRIYAAVQANPGLDENGIFEFMKRKDREKD